MLDPAVTDDQYAVAMTAGPLVTKLLSPTGFVMAGLCVLLPFGAVSCQQGSTHGTLTYTGIQLIKGSGGSVAVTPSDLAPFVDKRSLAEFAGSVLQETHIDGVRMLLIAGLIAAFIGVLSAALRPTLVRVTVAAAMAVAALVVQVGAVLAGRHEVAVWFVQHPPARGPSDPLAVVDGLPAGLSIQPGIGFWISLALLVAVGAVNIAAVFTETRTRSPAGAIDPVTEQRT
jgi:hypothetical protein